MFEIYFLIIHWKSSFLVCLKTGATSKGFHDLRAVSHQFPSEAHKGPPPTRTVHCRAAELPRNLGEVAAILVKISQTNLYTDYLMPVKHNIILLPSRTSEHNG